MTYKKYQKALAICKNLYTEECEHVKKLKLFNKKRWSEGKVTFEEYTKESERLDDILKRATDRYDRYVERLKMHFAMQDAPAKVGDILWSGNRIIRGEQIKLSAFDFPMLKYFGVQLTTKGLPYVNQKKYPDGGIYQKNVTSVNGVPYTYKVRE